MATGTDVNNDDVLRRWLQLQSQLESDRTSPNQRANVLRGLLCEIQYQRTIGKLSTAMAKIMSEKYFRQYMLLVDGSVETNGLDSYLDLVKGRQLWKESEEDVEKCGDPHEQKPHPTLDLDTVQEMPFFQMYMKSAKAKEAEYNNNEKPDTVASFGGAVTSSGGAVASSLFSTIGSKRKASDDNMRGLSDDVYQQSSRRTRGPPNLIPGPSDHTPDIPGPAACNFRTAKHQLLINQTKQRTACSGAAAPEPGPTYGLAKKCLGARRGLSSKFVPPIAGREQETGSGRTLCRGSGPREDSEHDVTDITTDERLKNMEPKLIERIMNEILDNGPPMTWDDIAGLEFAKKTIKEIVVWPMLRPDIFTGLRGPPKGLLLFGPPGTGKTLIGKCIASQSKSTFFSISSSSLTSKWIGEGEMMVRTLFTVARCHQPAVVFIDEIDSLLTQRTDGEHEASRRIKTEFLVQLDGATTDSDERLLVIGATNRPQEIDEAARRRFVKRLYIPLPDSSARRQIIRRLMSAQNYQLSDDQLDDICTNSDGYSGADMSNLCREAALGPIRCIPFDDIEHIAPDQVRAIEYRDFTDALLQVKASVSEKDLAKYVEWNERFGSGRK